MSASGRVRSLARQNLAEFRSDPVRWFVLVGNRLLVAGLVTSLFAVLLGALLSLRLVTVARTDQMIYLSQGLFTGTVTLVTIVLAINQLVLSREFRSPGELADHLEETRAYRDRVEATTGRAVMPETPADFLSVLLDGTRETAQRLGGIVADHDHDEVAAEVDDLVSTITAEVEAVTDELADSEPGVFETLQASLETNFSHPLTEANRVQTVYEPELSDAAHAALEDLTTGLEQVDIARQYFKSLYIQAELADLSRSLLYAGLPAIGGSILMYLIYVGGPSAAVERAYLPGFVLGVVVLCVLPIAILFSFVLRIATVAKRTVAITPFTMPTRETDAAGAAREG